MKLIDILGSDITFENADTSLDIISIAFQLAIIEFMKRERILTTLEKENYLYREALGNALKQKASIHQIAHSFMEIERYCTEKEDCEGELSELVQSHLKRGIKEVSTKVHLSDKNRHGRTFRSHQNGKIYPNKIRSSNRKH